MLKARPGTSPFGFTPWYLSSPPGCREVSTPPTIRPPLSSNTIGSSPSNLPVSEKPEKPRLSTNCLASNPTSWKVSFLGWLPLKSRMVSSRISWPPMNGHSPRSTFTRLLGRIWYWMTPFSTVMPGLTEATVATWCGAVSRFSRSVK